MRFCIVGAGAIGGFVGARLALAGEDVTFIARWKNLDAIRARGMTVRMNDGTLLEATSVKATESFAAVGHVDCVILALKAHQVESVVNQLGPLFGPRTTVITMQNGIPFWYFHNHGGELAGSTVKAVDPRGVCKDGIAPERIIGCVVYPATELVAPGVVQHIEGERFPLGELDGSASNRVKDLADIFVKSGLKAPVLDNIRNEIWLKLWGNLTFNPISALTHATLQDICRFPLGRTHDEGSAGRGRETRRQLSRQPGKAHRGRREGRPPQNLDAAGCGGGPRHRNRCPGGRGHRAWRTHPYAHTHHQRDLSGIALVGAHYRYRKGGDSRYCPSSGLMASWPAGNARLWCVSILG
jgi:2-dehydropantoate 2-reductase